MYSFCCATIEALSTVLTQHATKIPSTIRRKENKQPIQNCIYFFVSIKLHIELFLLFLIVEKYNCIHSQSALKYESSNDKREFSELNGAHYSRKLSVSFR